MICAKDTREWAAEAIGDKLIEENTGAGKYDDWNYTTHIFVVTSLCIGGACVVVCLATIFCYMRGVGCCKEKKSVKDRTLDEEKARENNNAAQGIANAYTSTGVPSTTVGDILGAVHVDVDAHQHKKKRKLSRTNLGDVVVTKAAVATSKDKKKKKDKKSKKSKNKADEENPQ